MKRALHYFNNSNNGLIRFEWSGALLLLLMTFSPNMTMANTVASVGAIEEEEINGGTLSEDDYSFCVGDGVADHVSNVSAENAVGPNMQWVVTSTAGEILGLPPTAEAVNFEGAGAGTCLIWNLAYADGLTGLEVGNNAMTDLVGTYDFSDDYVTVTRNQPEAGELLGGPFAFNVDGAPDMVSGLSLEGDRTGTNSTFVITDDQGKILGLPPTMEAVEGVNFDGAGTGTCLIWYLRYEDGLVGAKMGLNANDLMGCYDLSNPVEVVRTQTVTVEGGSLNEDDFYFCVDGTADHVSKVSVEGASGPNGQWVVTSPEGVILGLPPTPEAVNFDEAGAGVCLIWYLSYADGLEGLEGGKNVADLEGTHDFSKDYVTVTRSKPEAGELLGGPFSFDVDGTPDMVNGLSLDGERSGTNSSWVITDDQGKILGLPPTLEAVEGVNFDGAGAGTCLIWYLRYEDGLIGAEMGLNANDLMGCFDLSNPVEVVRTDAVAVNGGTLSEDDYSFCVGDGVADHVSNVSAENAVGPNMQWVVTSTAGEILGLPPTAEAVNFDGAGAGTCLIWNLAYADGLTGLEVGNNAMTDLVGTYDFSDDYVTVTRNQPEAGELLGGPFAFNVDGAPDMVSGLSLEGDRTGTNSTFVITDDQGKILGLPPTMEAVEGVNFDGAGAGTCLIWYLRYEDGLVGAEMDLNAHNLMGCFDLSNPVEVVRTVPVSGKTSVSLFPNPSSDKLNISVGSTDVRKVKVSLFDFGGNDITKKMRRNNEEGLSFDVRGIPSGIYLVSVNDGTNVTTKKVIIR